jgi:hypothetical protein
VLQAPAVFDAAAGCAAPTSQPPCAELSWGMVCTGGPHPRHNRVQSVCHMPQRIGCVAQGKCNWHGCAYDYGTLQSSHLCIWWGSLHSPHAFSYNRLGGGGSMLSHPQVGFCLGVRWQGCFCQQSHCVSMLCVSRLFCLSSFT